MIINFYNPCRACGNDVLVLADAATGAMDHKPKAVICPACGEWRYADQWNALMPLAPPPPADVFGEKKKGGAE